MLIDCILLLLSRRLLFMVPAAVVTTSAPVWADGDLIVLTEEEMAARVARKQELLRKQSQGSSYGRAPPGSLDAAIRVDFNPEAAVSLRSRSVLDNARVALEKQDEMKKRDKKQKRDDLCEMLGRGC